MPMFMILWFFIIQLYIKVLVKKFDFSCEMAPLFSNFFEKMSKKMLLRQK